MLSAVRKILISVSLPLSWRKKDRMARSLDRFSKIEADSAWQFLNAVRVLPTPAQRAQMFLNSMEEDHHAQLFGTLARKVAETALPPTHVARKALMERPDQLGDFLAYIHVGELDIYGEFETYARVSGNTDVRNLFMHIREDEKGHQDTAHSLLVQAMGSEAAARKGLRKARGRRMWDAWLRTSEVMGEWFAGLWLGLLYWVAGPLFSGVCKRRLAQDQVSSEDQST